MATVSEFMYCPRCRVQLKKSAAAWVQSYLQQGGGAGIGMGTASTTTCPGCGAALDVQTMLAGGYDRRIETEEEKATRRLVTWMVLGFAALAVAAHYVAGTGFLGSVGLALGAAVAGGILVGIVKAVAAPKRPHVCKFCGTSNMGRTCTHCGGRVR